MFSIEFLHVLREYETNAISRNFPPGASILEFGGGTGYQAKQLAERGFKVVSIDVGASRYRGEQVFPVGEYDGKQFPFGDAVFDVVFSSNVLEHIADLAQIHRECRRVLKVEGYCVHVLPSAVWRFWDIIAHYVELVQRVAKLLPYLIPRSLRLNELERPYLWCQEMVLLGREFALVRRHGAAGNVLTELWTFSRRHWVKHFRRHGYAVLLAEELGLFYTGHMVFGKRWGLRSRERVARVLGSATMLYVVQPIAEGSLSERRVCRGD